MKSYFNFEEFLKLNINYMDTMADKDGLTYFDVFWTEPLEAAHDWPDFVDLVPRHLLSSLMVKDMLGYGSKNEELWIEYILGTIKDNGLGYRKDTSYSEPSTSFFDQSRLCYALVALYSMNKDEKIKDILIKHIDALDSVSIKRDGCAWYPAELYNQYYDEIPEDLKIGQDAYAMGGTNKVGTNANTDVNEHYVGGWSEDQKKNEPEYWIYYLTGVLIKPLVDTYRLIGYKKALTLAGEIVNALFDKVGIFDRSGHLVIKNPIHCHAMTFNLAGIIAYAVETGDKALLEVANKIWIDVSKYMMRNGFYLEGIARTGDVVMCETCAIMDAVEVLVQLANAGYTEYWPVVERICKNHLAENQIKELKGFVIDNTKEDTFQFTYKDLDKRLVGSWVGFGSPTQILAADEYMGWGGSELRNKVRLNQNCCGCSGVTGMYIAWKYATTFADNKLTVNIYADKLIEEAEVRCYEPIVGKLTIDVKKDCDVFIKELDFTSDMSVFVNKDKVEYATENGYIKLDNIKSGDFIEVVYPIDEYKVVETIGNAGRQQYTYESTWKGNTQIDIKLISEEYETGFSDYDKEITKIYMSDKGPGRLYVGRDNKYLAQVELACDKSVIRFWK